jgi:chromosome segregation protein
MQGFKSFADETLMLFDNGVTAIVGPNGCGKSNVSDAVRWVLGEQRARILRGAKMEEVIFQGSSARRAVNVAEVSLVFENDDSSLPTPFREVVVTRRLSRSGESDYLLNGVSCRLRDIHDLLRGTGLGADAGVVIEQRMIDALLSDRPDDRRELFEEAAGVGLYRERRRSTERRLEETSQDLARLDDLINEVQSQVRSLARQRKRAERHREMMERRFALELTIASRDMLAWREELDTLEAQLARLRQSTPRLASAVQGAEHRREETHAQRAVADAHRSELARQVTQLRQDAQEIRSQIAVAEERHRNALERRRRAEDERREGQAVGSRLQQERVGAAAGRTEAEAALTEAEEELRRAARDEGISRERLSNARNEVEAAESSARQLRERMRELELTAESTARELHDLEARVRTLDSERAQLVDAVESLAREIESSADEVAAARARVERTTNALEAARAEGRIARDHESACRTELGRTEDLHTALEGRVHGLEGLERERVGLAPAAARLLRERDRFGGSVLGPISDFITAAPSAAAAVERFLGMTLHAVLVRDRAAADEVREWHSRTNPGPLLLLPLDSINDSTLPGNGDLLGQVDVAPQAAGWVRVLLDRVRALNDNAFVDTRGAIWLPGASAGPGPLRRRAELFALRSGLGAADSARSAAKEAADAARTALREAETGIALAVDDAAAAQEEERRASEVVAELQRRKARYERDLDDSRSLAGRLTSRADELGAQHRDAEIELGSLRDSVADHEQRVLDARQRLADGEHGMESSRQAHTAAQVTVARVQARLQVAMDRERRLAEEEATAVDRLTSLSSELESLDAADRTLGEQMALWQADLPARNATLGDVEARHAAAEADVRVADTSVAEAESNLDAAHRETQEHAAALHHAELRFTELAGKRTAIRERLEAEWHRPLDEMLAAFQPLDTDDELLRQEAEQLRQQIEALGPVNPLAIEEHEEEVKRFEFLTGQRNDLHEARNSLQQAIREIDTTARALFLDTFARTRENFRSIFMTLFGGGECDLRLENPDAPLDCDIEIHASPRGKRTQRIHLLSSGERALVALSLLFGIFLTKPSPFCLLDEVDAPLDDANIGRFVRMLNEFKMKTQFIVITHNPRTTTEAADAVYGVTMQEPGVSSVVSVRMRGAPIDDQLSDVGPVERTLSVVQVGEAVAAG